MVDLERLKMRSLRAYEVSRLRMALRVGLFLVPTFVICWFVGERELCACLMPLLACLVIWLRWRDRQGVDDVSAGLAAGSIPLGVGLLLSALGTTCGGPLCLGLSASAGVAAGVWIATDSRRRASPWSSWLAATSIAAVAAVLGCSALGVFGIVGALLGIAVGSALGSALSLR